MGRSEENGKETSEGFSGRLNFECFVVPCRVSPETKRIGRVRAGASETPSNFLFFWLWRHFESNGNSKAVAALGEISSNENNCAKAGAGARKLAATRAHWGRLGWLQMIGCGNSAFCSVWRFEIRNVFKVISLLVPSSRKTNGLSGTENGAENEASGVIY